jgi:biopolymer transport protein ExbD
MEKLRRDLKDVSKRLSNLVQQLEKIIIRVDKRIQFSKIPKVKSTIKKP